LITLGEGKSETDSTYLSSSSIIIDENQLLQQQFYEVMMFQSLQSAELVSLKHPKYLCQSIILTIVTDLAILLSFGMMFPPLAVLVILSMIKDLINCNIFLGRFLQLRQFTNI
jgi:hypothetical protein